MKNMIPTFVGQKKAGNLLCDVFSIGPYKLIIEIDSTRVFPPSETTLALADAILKYKVSSVFDVGTGSGLLAMVAAKRGAKKVVALDINPSAIDIARKNSKLNGVENIRFVQGDIADEVHRGKFDLIVTNPPFMPMPKGSEFVSDDILKAIHGGPEGTGCEILFAKHIRRYLKNNGVLLFPIPEFGNFGIIAVIVVGVIAAVLIIKKK